ncbi:MAG: uracil-DNA glycosylase [Burkholderiaceae bacterium]
MTPDQHKAWVALGLGPAYQPRIDSVPGAVHAVSPAENHGAAGQEDHMIDPPADVSVVSSLDTERDQAARLVSVQTLNWHDLRTEVSACQQCALGASRRNAVFGVGVDSPTWVVVGEAPGEQEDRNGEPFVGEAGHLLDAMLASVGAARTTNVFVLNVLKCRPPGNRDPEADEVATCKPFLLRQLELLNPELILTVGRFAAQTLLGVNDKIGALRGRVHKVAVGDRQVPMVASYHPAYFLRRPEEKLKGWQDLCLATSVVPAKAQ